MKFMEMICRTSLIFHNTDFCTLLTSGIGRQREKYSNWGKSTSWFWVLLFWLVILFVLLGFCLGFFVCVPFVSFFLIRNSS